MAFICLLFFLFEIVLFATIILSWFPIAPGTALASVYSVCFRITDPVLGPIRRAVPALRIGGLALDLSPFIVLIGLRVIRAFIGC